MGKTKHVHGPPVQFEITSDTRTCLLAWLERRGGSVEDFAFPCRVHPIGLMGGWGHLGAAALRGELER